MKILLIIFYMTYGDYTIATPYTGTKCEAERKVYLDVQVEDDVESVLIECVTKEEMTEIIGKL